MNGLVLALAAGAAALAYLWDKMNGNPAASPLSTPQRVYDAIKREIVDSLGLPQRAADILVFQSSRETGRWKAWYFEGPQKDGLPPTHSLFNRRVGSGKGEWTGKVKMINGDDTRIFTDVYQSARDFRQRLTAYADGREALAALRAGDGKAYFLAWEKHGFSARKGDYAAYAQQWASGVA